MEKDRKWKAGAGMAEIEYPACFFPEEGFFRIHDPIHARVLILEEEERFVIVSLELPSLRPYTLIDEMKRVVREAVGVNDKNIWICVTLTWRRLMFLTERRREKNMKFIYGQ